MFAFYFLPKLVVYINKTAGTSEAKRDRDRRGIPPLYRAPRTPTCHNHSSSETQPAESDSVQNIFNCYPFFLFFFGLYCSLLNPLCAYYNIVCLVGRTHAHALKIVNFSLSTYHYRYPQSSSTAPHTNPFVLYAHGTHGRREAPHARDDTVARRTSAGAAAGRPFHTVYTEARIARAVFLHPGS